VITGWTTGSRFGVQWEGDMRAGRRVEVFTMGIKHEVFLTPFGGLFQPGCSDCEWVGATMGPGAAMDALIDHVTPDR
jgi:hypothetical protein